MEMPLPPVELALRVGVPDHDDPLGSYERLGRDSRELVLDLLPEGWSFEGKRVLDLARASRKGKPVAVRVAHCVWPVARPVA